MAKSIQMKEGSSNIYPIAGESGDGYIKLADGTLIKWGNAKVVTGSYAPIIASTPLFVGQHGLVASVHYEIYSTLGLTCITQPQTSGQDNVYVRQGNGNQLSAADLEKASVDYVQIGRWK